MIGMAFFTVAQRAVGRGTSVTPELSSSIPTCTHGIFNKVKNHLQFDYGCDSTNIYILHWNGFFQNLTVTISLLHFSSLYFHTVHQALRSCECHECHSKHQSSHQSISCPLPEPIVIKLIGGDIATLTLDPIVELNSHNIITLSIVSLS